MAADRWFTLDDYVERIIAPHLEQMRRDFANTVLYGRGPEWTMRVVYPFVESEEQAGLVRLMAEAPLIDPTPAQDKAPYKAR